MKNKKLLAIPLVVVAAGAGLLWFLFRSGEERGVLRISGNIEVTDAEVSFKIPGRVEQRLVDEGDRVSAGQLVARLDSRELAQEVALRQAEVQASEAVLAELEAGSRPEEIGQAAAAFQRAEFKLTELQAGSRPQEVATAEAAVASARAELDRLETDYRRQENLFKKEVISEREFQAAKAAYDVAAARLKQAEEQLLLVREGPRKEQIDQAKAALDEARERYVLVKKGPRAETVAQARARLQQAREALALAQTRLSYAEIASPLTGVVLSKSTEPGEIVAAGTPIVTVGDLAHCWLRGYVEETDLGRVSLGQRVRVATDGRPGKAYEGKVSFISAEAEFTPKSVQTQKERVKLVYRIKVDIPNPELELKPGMPADGDIQLDGKAE
jgi:HlyD family secretion protein